MQTTERMVRGQVMDRDFDYDYWNGQPQEARWKAAWEMIQYAVLAKGGGSDELRIQRTVERLIKRRS